MKIFKALALLGGLIVAVCTPAAAATLHVKADPGGVIVDYIRQYSDIRSSGGKIVIDGPCVSACTTFLGIMPKESVCATDNASLGFHSASSMTEEKGKKVYTHAIELSVLMFNLYPAETRALLIKNGWWGPNRHPNLIFFKGAELFTFLRKCDASEVP